MIENRESNIDLRSRLFVRHLNSPDIAFLSRNLIAVYGEPLVQHAGNSAGNGQQGSTFPQLRVIAEMQQDWRTVAVFRCELITKRSRAPVVSERDVAHDGFEFGLPRRNAIAHKFNRTRFAATAHRRDRRDDPRPRRNGQLVDECSVTPKVEIIDRRCVRFVGVGRKRKRRIVASRVRSFGDYSAILIPNFDDSIELRTDRTRGNRTGDRPGFRRRESIAIDFSDPLNLTGNAHGQRRDQLWCRFRFAVSCPCRFHHIYGVIHHKTSGRRGAIGVGGLPFHNARQDISRDGQASFGFPR